MAAGRSFEACTRAARARERGVPGRMERILEMSAIGTEEGAAARQLALVDSVLAEMRWRGRRKDMVGGGRGGKCRERGGRERN
jgi:hypothetical protein